MTKAYDAHQRRDLAAIELVLRAKDTSPTPEMVPELLGDEDPNEIICALIWHVYTLATAAGAMKPARRRRYTGDEILAQLAEGIADA
jgi:hypothetical protein